MSSITTARTVTPGWIRRLVARWREGRRPLSILAWVATPVPMTRQQAASTLCGKYGCWMAHTDGKYVLSTSYHAGETAADFEQACRTLELDECVGVVYGAER